MTGALAAVCAAAASCLNLSLGPRDRVTAAR
jgi:hypothetical protein